MWHRTKGQMLFPSAHEQIPWGYNQHSWYSSQLNLSENTSQYIGPSWECFIHMETSSLVAEDCNKQKGAFTKIEQRRFIIVPNLLKNRGLVFCIFYLKERLNLVAVYGKQMNLWSYPNPDYQVTEPLNPFSFNL